MQRNFRAKLINWQRKFFAFKIFKIKCTKLSSKRPIRSVNAFCAVYNTYWLLLRSYLRLRVSYSLSLYVLAPDLNSNFECFHFLEFNSQNKNQSFIFVFGMFWRHFLLSLKNRKNCTTKKKIANYNRLNRIIWLIHLLDDIDSFFCFFHVLKFHFVWLFFHPLDPVQLILIQLQNICHVSFRFSIPKWIV